MTSNTISSQSSLNIMNMMSSQASLQHCELQEYSIRLPVELWLEILEYLTTSSLKDVSRTCRAFRWLAQPLLFKLFVIRIHLPTIFIRGDTQQTNDSACLSVLSLPHIANAIEELKIIPLVPSSPEIQNHAPGPLTQSAEELIDVVFNVLPLLANLKKLVCYDIVFTPSRLLALHCLRKLRDLELQSCYTTCDADAFPDFSSIPLESLLVDYPYSSLDFYRNPRFLALFLQSRNLKRVFAGPANDIVFALTQTNTLNSLTTLEIPVSCIASPVFIPALACCPAVMELSLHMVLGNNHLPHLDAIPSELLPELRSYRGPRIYALLFTRDRNVSYIELSLACQPDDLSETILGLDADIQSLSCKVHHLDAPLLKTIHNKFPSLKHLAVSGAAVDIHALCTILDIAKIHKSLTSIHLTIQMGLPRLTASWRSIAARMFLTRLVQSYPVLQTAKLTYQPDVAVVWRRPSTMSHTEPVIDASEFWVERQQDLPRKTTNFWDLLRVKH